MRGKIKVRFASGGEKELTVEEAKKLLAETYSDPMGGLVADAKTERVIYQIEPGIEEIFVLDTIIGGG
jgi:hypothetical protein